jgi:formylglycine-generating enzyme required for sulfatase activity
MKRTTLFSIMSAVLLSASPVFAVSIQWAPVGNPGNAADTAVMSYDGTSGYGSVSYNYNIAEYDVTNSQYAEFLNAKDPDGTNSLGLYCASVEGSFKGISFAGGNAPGSKYELVPGRENHPVNYVSFYDAIRFANWLNNGQGNGDTETGAYTLGPLGAGGLPINGDSITRNAGASIFLPSEDEWYKAAYYDPTTDSYFQYPTSSNTAPLATGPTGALNAANYENAVGDLTNVGAYSGTVSPYGAFDMGGNVFQWNESTFLGTSRGWRGGAFNLLDYNLLSTERGTFGLADNDTSEVVGFRLVSVPEPSTISVATSAVAGIFAYGFCRLRRR